MHSKGLRSLKLVGPRNLLLAWKRFIWLTKVDFSCVFATGQLGAGFQRDRFAGGGVEREVRRGTSVEAIRPLINLYR